jgi:hypothetical protein
LQGLVADLVKGVRGIGDELSQKDFLRVISKEGIFPSYLVGVDSVHKQGEKLADFGLQSQTVSTRSDRICK